MIDEERYTITDGPSRSCPECGREAVRTGEKRTIHGDLLTEYYECVNLRCDRTLWSVTEVSSR